MCNTAVCFVVRSWVFFCIVLCFLNIIGDRPFNLKGGLWFFASFKKKFRTTRELEFFFQNSTLGYMAKTLNQIFFFFPPPKSESFFQQHWESEHFFRKKKHNPSFKLNGRSLIGIVSTYLHKYQYLQNKYIYYFTFIVPSIYDFIIKLGAAMAVVE